MNNIIIFTIIILLFILFYYYFFFLHKEKKIYDKFNNYKSQIVRLTKTAYNNNTIIIDDNISLHYSYSKLLSTIYPVKVLKGSGTFDTIKEINNNNISFGLAQEDMVINSVLGIKTYSKRYNNIKFIKGIYEEQINLITNTKYNIDSWNDLKGKTVCFGRKNSSSLYNGLELCKIINIKKNDLKIIYGNITDKNIRKLIIDDTIQAIFIIGENPNTYIKELFRIKLLNMIGTKGIPNELIKLKFPLWRKSKINIKNYNIPSFNYYLDTWGIRIILITNSNQNNNIIYSLIKTIFENNMYIRDNINNDDQKQVLQNFSVEDSFENRNIIPLHNGVKLYYKHIGLISNDKNPNCSFFVGTGNCNLEILDPFYHSAKF